jgi:hypothetical protein
VVRRVRIHHEVVVVVVVGVSDWNPCIMLFPLNYRLNNQYINHQPNQTTRMVTVRKTFKKNECLCDYKIFHYFCYVHDVYRSIYYMYILYCICVLLCMFICSYYDCHHQRSSRSTFVNIIMRFFLFIMVVQFGKICVVFQDV